jgi:hypothetical protein
MPGLPYFKVEPELALVVARQQEPLQAQPYGGELGDTGAGKGSALSVSPYLTGDARPVCVRKALGSLDLRLLVSYRGYQFFGRSDVDRRRLGTGRASTPAAFKIVRRYWLP